MNSEERSGNDGMINAFDENFLSKEYFENVGLLQIDSLQRIAASKVILTLCQREEIHAMFSDTLLVAVQKYYFERHYLSDNLRMCLAKMTEKLLIPSLIRRLLPPIIKLVSYELERWTLFLAEYVGQKLFPRSIYHIVWRPDGFINDFETAKRIVTDSGLESELKFRLVCLYCLEDCLNVCSSDSFDSQYCHALNFEKNPLEFYWTSYVVDNLAGMRKRIPENFPGSINDYFLTLADVNRLPAFLYFWNKLNDERKVYHAQHLSSSIDFPTVLLILSQLSESQQLEVLRSVGSFILCTILDSEYLIRYFLPIAYRSRDVLSNADFVDVLDAFTDTDLIFITDQYGAICLAVFVEFWCFVPSSLRTFAFSFRDGHLMEIVIMDLVKNLRRNIDYLIRLFLCVDYEIRQRFMFSLKNRHRWRRYVVEESAREYMMQLLNNILTPGDVQKFFDMFANENFQRDVDFYSSDDDHHNYVDYHDFDGDDVQPD